MSIYIIQLMAYPAELPSIIAAAAGFALAAMTAVFVTVTKSVHDAGGGGPIRRQLALATKRIRRPRSARSNTR
jgi:hypothetical protein